MTDVASRELRLPQHLSYSQSNTYNHCPRQYLLERGLKVPSKPAWALLGGGAVHAATEDFDVALSLGDEFEDHRVVAAFNSRLDEEIAEQAEKGWEAGDIRASGRASKQWPEKENEAWWRANGPSMCLSWKQWRASSPWEIAEIPNEDGEPVPAIEWVFEFEVAPGIPVKGAIDRLFTYQGSLGNVDIKSGRPPASDSQLKLYSLAVQRLLGLTTDWGCYWMARDGSTTSPVSLNPLNVAGIEYDFTTTKAGIDARLFPARVQPMCSSCSVRSYCYGVGGELSTEIPLSFPRAECDTLGVSDNKEKEDV